MNGWPGRIFTASSRISVRLYAGIGGAVSLTLAASLIAWYSFNSVGDAQRRVNEYIPDMADAFLVARQSGALVAAAPRLTGAATREDFARARDQVAGERSLFEERLAALIRREEDDAGVRNIRLRAEALMENLREIENSVDRGFALSDRSDERRAELVALQQSLERLLVEVIDDQFFYATTGYRSLEQPPAARREHFTEDEYHRYRRLMELQLAGALGMQILASVFNVSDARLLEPLQERFEATASGADSSLKTLGDAAGLPPALRRSFDRLIELGMGEDNTFDLRARALALVTGQQALLIRNRSLARELGAEIESKVDSARGRSLIVTRDAAESISTGRNLLLWINVLSIAGAFLIGWFFVGALVGRIRRLSDKMRTMAAGDLEAPVELGGRDEVAEMASALEIFRRASLEAQRLNLVEKLAEELRGKNEELETVLGDLRQAQDQIVMREKLAALGELTAGVAHEIKNPLNFIKNFSEGSIEMLVELQEAIPEAVLTAEQHKLVREISADLDENLATIQRHGERANRIVQDMLSMGRDSGDWQVTDINTLLTEHVRLAFHSARATDPDFQLDIEEHLDPEVGELNVIPHDLGRVFLNMVSNACYATDEKRRRGERAGYQPLLEVSTRRGPDSITISIRDNGDGIPAELVEKVFNPFFTTKPADKGTGLGLALSSDIVREHGGAIRVDTEAGEYTEMHIELPLTTGAAATPSAAEREAGQAGEEGG